MLRFKKQKLSPDFESLEKVLKGDKKPERVYFVELLIDDEIIRYFVENIWNEQWIPLTKDTMQEYQKKWVDFYYRMGYDCAKMKGIIYWKNMPQFRDGATKDTADLSRGERTWAIGSGGIIKNWDDFHRVKWHEIKYDFRALEYAIKALPEGMKILISTGLFEIVLEKFLGYEGLFMLSYDNPELVAAVFEEWGKIVYKFYSEAIEYPGVGAIFHCDDLGSKNSTLISPELLRKNVFPWFKKFSSLAHKQGKMYWFHSCGNVFDIMEDLIYDIKIDAFHSFQDQIMPINKFMGKYPNIAALGGIDMDKLGRMEEPELRRYVKRVLDDCMPGKFALGSGNSIANYIPVNNYLAMLDEGLNWK